MAQKQQSRFFRVAFRLVKYFLLSVFGLAIAVFLSGAFGFLHTAWIGIKLIAPWLLRSAVIVGCFLTVAIIFESIRQ